MILFYITHPWLIKKDGFFFPLVVNTRLKYRAKKTAQLKLMGRVFLGNNKLLSLSTVAANIQLGPYAQLKFGKSVSVGPGVNLIVKDSGILDIGDNTYFTSDSHIESKKNIKIGSGCAISWGVTIIDDDHHQLNYTGKKETATEVNIGNHVWIGCNSVILKGTSVGNGSVIAAGSIVKGNFPARCLIAGNPAKIIREDISWQ